MLWYACSVAVRFVGKEDTHATSGIHLVQRSEAGSVISDFVLTVGYFAQLDSLRVLVNSSNNAKSSLKEIFWYPGKLVAQYGIALNMEVLDELRFFKSSSFHLIPNDILNRQTLGNLSLLHIELGSAARNEYFANSTYEPISFDWKVLTTVGLSIVIVLSPFNFTNSLLFSNFLSSGTVIYSFPGGVGYLTDIKYLENMCGAVVNRADKPSVSLGLVLGSLRKQNGDGDLMMILSWKIIRDLMVKHQPAGREAPQLHNNKLASKIPSVVREPREVEWIKNFTVSHSTSVFPIRITTASDNSWGTCIYYNETTLVTNFHVLKPFVESDSADARCDIFLSNAVILTLTQDDLIFTPFKAIDLSFIKLSPKNLSLLTNSNKDYEPVKPTYDYKVGQKVTSKSFGLFLNTTNVKALESKGIVNSIFQLALHDDGKATINSVIITSSSCWNGSSGGAIHLNSDNSFIGIICSNAQVKLPLLDVELEEDKIEKLLRFSFVLPVQLIDYSYNYVMNKSAGPVHLSGQIRDSWQLKTFHEDIVLEPTKL